MQMRISAKAISIAPQIESLLDKAAHRIMPSVRAERSLTPPISVLSTLQQLLVAKATNDALGKNLDYYRFNQSSSKHSPSSDSPKFRRPRNFLVQVCRGKYNF